MEEQIMTITITELRTHLSKYLDLVKKEDIIVTKKGKIVALLSCPYSNKIKALRSLIGIAKNGNNITLKEIKEERICKL